MLKQQATYFKEVQEIIEHIDYPKLWAMTNMIRDLKGRLFILGVGGSAANASHAVNDFRKIGGIEAYTPTDNVAELTARTNDDGWPNTFKPWLQTSNLNKDDMVMVLSVGGGTYDASQNITEAVSYAHSIKCKIVGIVGPKGGITEKFADVCVKIPAKKFITPMVESFQQIIWHQIISVL